MLLAARHGATPRERLHQFYAPQAADYDALRAHLLPGRRELYRALPLPPGAVWIDLGAGTGHCLEHVAERVPHLGSVHLVDVCAPLLAVARRRVAEYNWNNVFLHDADAAAFAPGDGCADVVTLSYCLTMMPNWRAVLQRALRLLHPGGTLGLVDFYVSAARPRAGLRRHGWLCRAFWPAYFGWYGVHPSPAHLPWVLERCEPLALHEGLHRLPFSAGSRVPYYRLLARKA